MATETATEVAVERRCQQLPPFRVVLHNDDVNTFDHVIVTIVKLTPLEPTQAVERTLEAHETGCSTLLSTNRERAELYVEQFTSAGLIATCEPD